MNLEQAKQLRRWADILKKGPIGFLSSPEERRRHEDAESACAAFTDIFPAHTVYCHGSVQNYLNAAFGAGVVYRITNNGLLMQDLSERSDIGNLITLVDFARIPHAGEGVPEDFEVWNKCKDAHGVTKHAAFRFAAESVQVSTAAEDPFTAYLLTRGHLWKKPIVLEDITPISPEEYVQYRSQRLAL